ncbi:MAG: hypothetical protein EA398_06675 [Deltaproteobacteria bacterium]|nr:MAG: hypothetical protein EA398_06675 [Deltaproteobacteria bacterium]
MDAIPPIPPALPLHLLALVLVLGSILVALPYLKRGLLGRRVDLAAWFFEEDGSLTVIPLRPRAEPEGPEAEDPRTD